MIARDTVEKIAKLARLKLSETELEKYTDQLNQILGHVEKLNELDTTSIQATSHAVEIPDPLREDKVVVSHVIEEVLKISPDHEDNFFRVPKVL
jgi:aspartyl-tRNA(Asn)/glutamyl-tRNA(Gln) amidotransferase subunit C